MAQEQVIFPNNIRNIRLANGMKMTELARRTKLSLSAVSKIEKGVRRLNQKQLLSICNILGCKLSDIFIKESDADAGRWQSEIKRRLKDNENGGLKIFGSGLRKIRQTTGKTIARAAKDAGMTLSVYHKIEIGQREIYQNEIEPLAKSFAMSVESLFNKIANLYKSGELAKQMNKEKERVTSVLVPVNPSSSVGVQDGLYGAKIYEFARRKLIPVFGTPSASGISFSKSDKSMIVAPLSLEDRAGVYAVIPNVKRLGGFVPEKSYIFADSEQKVSVGDMAVCIDGDFGKLNPEDVIKAQVVTVKRDAKGKLYGFITNPDEKIYDKTMHRVVMMMPMD